MHSKLSLELQKHFALELARGLFYLHNQNVLHCDLKSANVLVGANNDLKITDFGISKTKAASVASLNKTSYALEVIKNILNANQFRIFIFIW